MGGLFGKSKKPVSRVTEQDKAILQLKHQRDQLKKYQRRIEQSLEKDRELARKCIQTGRKERAKLLLRKKKYQEKLLQNADGQLENLEKLTADIEFAQIEQQVLDGLKTGNAALKKVHEVLNIDEIERVLEETQEGVEKQHEIDSVLSGALTDQDEEDVLNELDALVAADADLEKINENYENEDISNQLPEVPTDELPQKKVKTDKTKIAEKVPTEA